MAQDSDVCSRQLDLLPAEVGNPAENQAVDEQYQAVRFTWTIENVSRLTNKMCYSDVFLLGGYKWRVLIFPKGNNVDHLSMYLDVADASSLPYGWSKHAQFNLEVVNQVHTNLTISKYAQHQFDARESDWGFTSFMPLSDLYDPTKGYLINDTYIIHADLAVRKEVDYPTHDSKKETSHVAPKKNLQTMYRTHYFSKIPSWSMMMRLIKGKFAPALVEVILGPDEGEGLDGLRTLKVKVDPKGTLQRKLLFHTRCTVANKVCLLLIDSGSSINLVSPNLISKLNLSTEPHPTPYAAQWLNHGKGIQVSHRVLLSFSIGKKYEDAIWCDVIPMDVCDVLLGRPWLFDRKVIHDGYKNTYTFVMKDMNITLLPLNHAPARVTRT